MMGPPGEPGGYEVVVHAGGGHVLVSRLRAAGHDGRTALRRLRRWLATPAGRRVAARAGRGLLVVGVLVGGLAMARRWTAAAQGALSAVTGAYRSAAGAVGAAGRALRFLVPARWISALARWFAATGRSGAHVHCPDCHARIRSDARVCHRCGNRDMSGARGTGGRLAAVRWTFRVIMLRLYRRCPDCRRLVHTDAHVCHSCGYRLA